MWERLIKLNVCGVAIGRRGFLGWPWLRKFHLILWLRRMGVNSSSPLKVPEMHNVFSGGHNE